MERRPSFVSTRSMPAYTISPKSPTCSRKAGSSAKWMPGLMRKVKLRKSAETSGMAAAVSGLSCTGLAR